MSDLCRVVPCVHCSFIEAVYSCGCCGCCVCGVGGLGWARGVRRMMSVSVMSVFLSTPPCLPLVQKNYVSEERNTPARPTIYYAPTRPTIRNHDDLRAENRSLYTYPDSARKLAARCPQNRNHGYAALLRRRKSRRHPPSRVFAPRCAATNLRRPWLTILCAAPKKKQEKMSLGDFLGDQCTRHPLRLALVGRRLTPSSSWIMG
jgi:hypothetical protein